MKELFKKGLFLFTALIVSTLAHAQFLRTSYFMDGTHYRQQLNPALMPVRGYLNIPAIGSLNASVNSSSLGYQDVLDIIDNSEDGDYFMSNDFMNRLKASNDLNVNLSTDILSAGWYKGKNFWSINIGLRNDIGASIPKSMFQFMRNMDGLDGNDWNRLSNINERTGDLAMSINSYTEIGVGLARSINSRLTVGAKVKTLLGIGNVEMKINNISVNSNISGLDSNNPNRWNGSASIDVDATIESSSKLIELEKDYENQYVDNIDFGSFGFAGFGAAIDLGASYKLLDNLTLSASILDLGFIKWSEGNTNFAQAKTTHNYNLANESDRYEFADLVSSGEVLNFDMLQMKTDESKKKARSSSLTSTLVLGAEYGLLNNKLAVGALYTGRFAEPETISELTFSANFRPKHYFNLAASYSVLQGAGKTFGLAAKIGPLFVGTDYMFFGEDTKNINAFIGFSIPLNKKKKDLN